jgi:hypothetical protein
MHRSTSLAFAQATVYDHAGRACVHAVGTFKYVKRRHGALNNGDGTPDAAPPITD